jgi:hypothetical protein
VSRSGANDSRLIIRSEGNEFKQFFWTSVKKELGSWRYSHVADAGSHHLFYPGNVGVSIYMADPVCFL